MLANLRLAHRVSHLSGWRMRRELRLRTDRSGLYTVSTPATSSARTYGPTRAFTFLATRPSDDIPLPPLGPGRDTSKVGAAIKRRPGTVTIGRLNPSKLTPTDHLTTVRYSQHQLHVYTPFFPGRFQLVLPQSPRTNQSLSSVTIGGFLYYHRPTRAPPLAGELRFRVTASDDPTDFPSGLDLMTDRGVPWTIPLSVIATFEKHEPLRNLLTAVDEAVPQ